MDARTQAMADDPTPIINASPVDASVEADNDRLARDYSIDAYYQTSPWPIRFIEERRLRIIREFVDERAGMRIAEVGSGGGHVLRMFRQAKLCAIDVSSVFLETARKNLAGYDVTFIKGEVDKLDPLPTGFDRVICTEVLEHTQNPEAIVRTLARMLAPTGRAIITIPNDPLINGLKEVVRRTPLRWAFGNKIEWGGDHLHIHQWTPDEFRRLLGSAFHIIDQRSAPSDRVPVRACFLCVPRV